MELVVQKSSFLYTLLRCQWNKCQHAMHVLTESKSCESAIQLCELSMDMHTLPLDFMGTAAGNGHT